MKFSTFFLILCGFCTFFLSMLLLAYGIDQIGVGIAVASGYGSPSDFYEFFPPLFYGGIGLLFVNLIAAIIAKADGK
ncbi:MAG: hypothetical protein KH050_10615 [Clostridiaceae bacterium]|nr:hypothetical protein [Clostridiaceae bacterium]